MHGGHNGVSRLGDVFWLDLGTRRWHSVLGDADAVLYTRRSAHSAVALDARRVALFGGRADGYRDGLANDVLVVNSDNGFANCGYLGIEAGVTDACGGRTLSDDVVDISYSVLAIGATSGVSDGVDMDTTPSTTFPYMAAPSVVPVSN